MKIIKTLALSTLIGLSAMASVSAKVILPKICTTGGTATMIIRSVGYGDGYNAELIIGNQKISAYCEVGDCEVLYKHNITNIRAKIKFGSTYMEEHENTLTCTIEDIELNPYVSYEETYMPSRIEGTYIKEQPIWSNPKPPLPRY